jgi:hypothetical protein
VNAQVEATPCSEFIPSDERRALFDKYWAEAQTRQRSSSENFDKSILTYSSGGLAISFTFLKDFVPVKEAVFLPLLYSSWLCFVASTALTIISFLISYKAQELSISFAEEYFINGKDEYCNKLTWHGTAVKWFNIFSGALFVIALVATSFFVKLNMDEKAKTMERKIANDGMPPALMQKVTGSTEQRGLPAASMPKAPVSPKPSSPSTTPPTLPASQPASGSKN